MPAAAVSSDTQRLPSPALRRFAWGVLVYFVATILWGTLVRATGSGDGCGNHWPLCNDTVMQVSPSVSTIIEFTHRVTSGIAVALVVGLLVFAFRRFLAGHLARGLRRHHVGRSDRAVQAAADQVFRRRRAVFHRCLNDVHPHRRQRDGYIGAGVGVLHDRAAGHDQG